MNIRNRCVNAKASKPQPGKVSTQVSTILPARPHFTVRMLF